MQSQHSSAWTIPTHQIVEKNHTNSFFLAGIYSINSNSDLDHTFPNTISHKISLYRTYTLSAKYLHPCTLFVIFSTDGLDLDPSSPECKV